MKHLVITGLQWGDEGKGKIVDCLANDADIIIRFQGGNNAGHTINFDNKKYKISLIPSGIIRQSSMNVIGSGVVIDPFYLLLEIDRLSEQGLTISQKNLIVADNACLVLPIHKELDARYEEARGSKKIGTTTLGIGPAYEDKVGRRSLRMTDLCLDFNLETNCQFLRNKLLAIYQHHQVSKCDEEIEKICCDLIEAGKKLSVFVKPLWRYLAKAASQNKKMIYEGAQGFYLDIDNGYYPYVTSSNTIAQAAQIGSGFNFSGYKLGVVKAYSTRVGEGIFPTELTSKLGNKMAQVGAEIGTVTGRQRRCGWLDLVMLKQACVISGIDGLALTKLDVLDDFDEIKVCTSYKISNKNYDYMPIMLAPCDKITPVYKTFKGWMTKTSQIKKYQDLPENAKVYLDYISNFTNTKIAIVSVSPNREDTIYIQKFF